MVPGTTACLECESHLDDGGISGLFSSGGPSVRFLTRYDGEVSEPLVGRQGSRVSMRVARGSAPLLPSHGRGMWPRDVLKKDAIVAQVVWSKDPNTPGAGQQEAPSMSFNSMSNLSNKILVAFSIPG